MANLTPFEDDAGGRGTQPRPAPEPREDEPQLIVNLDGFEGPLDLLLTLARNAKGRPRAYLHTGAGRAVPGLRHASARRLRIELAAGYLVMAAWLAYLKSRLLLPDEEPDAEEPSGSRDGGGTRPQAAASGGDARCRCGPDGPPATRPGRVRRQQSRGPVSARGGASREHAPRAAARLCRPPHPARAPPPADRTLRLSLHGRRLPAHVTAAWAAHRNGRPWRASLPRGPGAESEAAARSGLASTLAASLELAREGRVQLRQLEPFGPIYLRRRREQP